MREQWGQGHVYRSASRPRLIREITPTVSAEAIARHLAVGACRAESYKTPEHCILKPSTIRRSMEPKYVLVKSYYGLGGDLCVLIGAMRLAQQSGRAVAVDWNGGFYGQVADGRLFNEFFEAPQYPTSGVFSGHVPTVFPPQWEGRTQLPPLSYIPDIDLTVSRPEEVPAGCEADCVVITRDSKLIHRKPEDYYTTTQRLKPVATIRTAVDHLHSQMGLDRPSIGIHFRHGNGERNVIPPDPRWFRNRINARLRTLGLEAKDVSLFVATDCRAVLDYFRRHYPNTYSSAKKYRRNGSGAMHVGRDDLSDAEKMKLAFEALTDMYTLARCSYFIGSKGFFSLFVRLARGRRHTTLYEGSRLFKRYDFSETYYPLSADPILAVPLSHSRTRMEGLFVQLTEQERQIYFFDEKLAAIERSRTEVTPPEVDGISRAVVARRTY